MDQEDPFEVKTESLEPKTQFANALDSYSSLSEEEIITHRDREIISLSSLYNDKIRVDSSNILDCVLVSDEEIIEFIYQNLLRIIISFHSQGNAEIWCFDGCKTPPSQYSDTNLVPDTCPRAPMKLMMKISRNIDSGLRRKLF